MQGRGALSRPCQLGLLVLVDLSIFTQSICWQASKLFVETTQSPKQLITDVLKLGFGKYFTDHMMEVTLHHM